MNKRWIFLIVLIVLAIIVGVIWYQIGVGETKNNITNNTPVANNNMQNNVHENNEFCVVWYI